jgi:hypothetical protein
MDSSASEAVASEFYVPKKLFEDEQVTLYTDFRMDVRDDQVGKLRMHTLNWMKKTSCRSPEED